MAEQRQSALVIPVPAVEPIVSPWRDRFDRSAAQGMPPHITVLYPFLAPDRLTDAVLAELRALCGRLDPIEVTFARTARFPGVLYLDPQPADDLRRLTEAVAERWPEAPPYGGIYDDVVPHLTVASADDATLDDIENELMPKLPLDAVLKEAALYLLDAARWQPTEQFPLGG